MIRCREIDRILCGAKIDEDLVISVRRDRAGGNATTLIGSTLEGLGSTGGHTTRAGGKIPHVGTDGRIAASLEDELRTRWLAASGDTQQQPIRLVGLREIVTNL